MATEVCESIPVPGKPLAFLSTFYVGGNMAVDDKDDVLTIRFGWPFWQFAATTVVAMTILTIALVLNEVPWPILAGIFAVFFTLLVVSHWLAEKHWDRASGWLWHVLNQTGPRPQAVRLQWDRPAGVLRMTQENIEVPTEAVRMVCAVSGWGKIQETKGFLGELSVVVDIEDQATRVPVLIASKWTVGSLAQRLGQELKVPVVITHAPPL